MTDQKFRPTPRASRSFIIRSEPDPTSIYGPGLSGDGLGNSTIGGPVGALKTFARFRAEQSSPLTSIYFAFLSADEPGYGAGTGGAWRLSLFEDDETENHFPNTNLLASVDVAAVDTTDNDKQVTFSTPYTTEAGKLYHLVFENTDAAPADNYFSLNNWVREIVDPGEIAYPRFADYSWGTAFFFNGVWNFRPNYLPLLQINYGNGQVQGMGYGEASYATEGVVGKVNGGSEMIRERFTVSGDNIVVSGFAVRLLRTASTSADLYVSLRDQFNTEIDSAWIPAASVMVGPAPTFILDPTWDDLGSKARWVFGNFSRSRTLEVGKEYSLRISSFGGTYWAWVMRRMTSGYLYDDVTAFSDGFAEYSNNGGMSWSGLGRVPGDSDLQFYLITHPE